MPQPAGGWISDRNQTLGQKCISNDRRAATRTGRCAVPAWVTLPGALFSRAGRPAGCPETYLTCLRELKRKFWRSTPNLIQTRFPGEPARPGAMSHCGGWGRHGVGGSTREIRRSAHSGDAQGARHQQRLHVSTASHLRVRWFKTLAQFSPQYQRTRHKEGLSQSIGATERSIEKGVAKIGPLGLVLASERRVVSVCRGDDKRISISETRYEDTRMASRNDHDLISHSRAAEHLGEMGWFEGFD